MKGCHFSDSGIVLWLFYSPWYSNQSASLTCYRSVVCILLCSDSWNMTARISLSYQCNSWAIFCLRCVDMGVFHFIFWPFLFDLFPLSISAGVLMVLFFFHSVLQFYPHKILKSMVKVHIHQNILIKYYFNRFMLTFVPKMPFLIKLKTPIFYMWCLRLFKNNTGLKKGEDFVKKINSYPNA